MHTLRQTIVSIMVLAVCLTAGLSNALAGPAKNTYGGKDDASGSTTTVRVHVDTPAVMNYLRPLARTRVPESVLVQVSDLIARGLASEPAISKQWRTSWIDHRSGKPVYRLSQVGDARWAGLVPERVQKGVRRAIDRISFQDPIGLFAFNNPFSHNRDKIELSRHYPRRFDKRMPASTGAITGEWLLNGADGLFEIARHYKGNPFSIEKHRSVLKNYQILAASYSHKEGRTVSYHYFWFEKAPPGWKTILADLPKGRGLEKIGPPVAMAPDYLNKALSMIHGHKAGGAASGTAGDKQPDPPPRLENPDGLYGVSEQGVVQWKVKKKEANGSYAIALSVLTSQEPTLRSGQLVSSGWWHPSHQQAYTTPYLDFGKGHGCNGWKEDWASWSSIVVPDVFMTGQGRFFPGYGYSRQSPPDRPHAERICGKVKAERPGCRISCINWRYGKMIPKIYLIRGKDQALSLYHYLKTRGARVTALSDIRARNQAASAAKQAKAQEQAARERKIQDASRVLSGHRDRVNFPKELAVTPVVQDFLLARFYPDRLNRQMLEGMMSSRWGYEKSLDNPIGGRFFKKGGKAPAYAELGLLAPQFKQWILDRAEALPETLVLDVSLVYGSSGMQIGTRCFKFLTPDGSPAGPDPRRISQAERQRKKCEETNRRTLETFDRCQRLRVDLARAQKHLADVRAGGCQPAAADDPAAAGSSGPCQIPPNLTLADVRAEMTNCINRACGTPTAGSDIQAYQKCVQAVSNQFKDEMARMMGQPVRPRPPAEPEDPCQAAADRVARIRKSLGLNQCSRMAESPRTVDCSRIGSPDRPAVMDVGRIDLEPMLTCSGGFSVFHRAFKESAALLPKNRPFVTSQVFFVLYPDRLALPNSLPPGVTADDSGRVKARIRLRVTGPDKRSFRRHQLGLKAVVAGVDYPG